VPGDRRTASRIDDAVLDVEAVAVVDRREPVIERCSTISGVGTKSPSSPAR
jgi:hypothetical protein